MTTPKNCPYKNVTKNGRCDDELNTPHCDYDNGECCGDVDLSYCTECICKDPTNTETRSNFYH